MDNRVDEADSYLQNNYDGYNLASACVVLDYWYPDSQDYVGIAQKICGNREDGNKTTIIDFKAAAEENDFDNLSASQAQIRTVAHETAHLFCGRHHHGKINTNFFGSDKVTVMRNQTSGFDCACDDVNSGDWDDSTQDFSDCAEPEIQSSVNDGDYSNSGC
jgi:hypothetical protein